MLLAAAGEEKLDPEAPLAAFVRQAPRLDPYGPLPGQLAELLARHRPFARPAEFTSSAPGASAALLRQHFYTLMDLAEPVAPARLEPLPLPPYEPPRRTGPLDVRARVRGAEVVIERAQGHPYGAGGETHRAVHEDTVDPADLATADVILRDGPPDDPRFGSPEEWAAEVLDRYPHCSLAAYVSGPDRCTVRTRDLGVLRLSAGSGADADPAVYASALHAWLVWGTAVPSRDAVPPRGGTAVPTALRVRVAGGVHAVEVARPGCVARPGSGDSPVP